MGKVVQFQVLYQIPSSKREYGIVNLQDGTSLPEAAIEAGWVKLREDAGRKEDTEEATQNLEKFRTLEAAARAGSKGVWQANGGRTAVQYDLPNPKEFVEEWKNKSIDCEFLPKTPVLYLQILKKF